MSARREQQRSIASISYARWLHHF